MLVKFFSNKKGGSSKAVDYLLNQREKERTAKVLQGDPQITKKIINSITRKQKVTVGCLSFEEKNIPEKQKFELMQKFEKMLMPEMENRYNILWVEHTDKGRLELNFVIPKTDLATNKALQPHYYKEDQKRVELFQKVYNLKYNYSSPTDPSKARNIEGATKKIELQKDYEQLDRLLHKLVQSGTIKNRTQLIELLKENNIEVNREGKDYIAIKLPESKRAKRFKKGIYSAEFTSITSIRAIGDRTREEINKYHSRDTQRELEELTKELDKFTRYKAEANRERYPRTNIQEYENKYKIYSRLDSSNNFNNQLSSDLLHYQEHNETMDSSKRVKASRETGGEVYSNTQREPYKNDRTEHKVHPNKGELDDSLRTDTIRRVRRTRATQLRDAREVRGGIQALRKKYEADERYVRDEIEDSFSWIRGEHKPDTEDIREDIRRRIYEEQKIYREINERLKPRIYIKKPTYQQQIFNETYKKRIEANLKGYYIDTKNEKNIVFSNAQKKIKVVDKGAKITANRGGNLQEKVQLMLEIAQAKGWNLEKLQISGNEEFKKEAKRQINSLQLENLKQKAQIWEQNKEKIFESVQKMKPKYRPKEMTPEPEPYRGMQR